MNAVPVVNNNKGSMLISVVFFGLLVGSAAMVTYLSASHTIKKIDTRTGNVVAFNIAEAGREHALALIRSGSVTLKPDTSFTIIPATACSNGSYTVTCSTNVDSSGSGVDTFWIDSRGSIQDESARVVGIYMVSSSGKKISFSLDAAVTTLSDIRVTGSCVIDGRNYDMNGLLKIFDSHGVMGVRACGTLNQTGASLIGGNGQVPRKNAFFPAVDHLVSSAGYPRTPEEVLGLKPGALQKYKTNSFSKDFKGIVYMTSNYGPPARFDDAEGIFICHNESCSAKMKNIHGRFRGLIIADQIDHINANTEIIGAIITLAPTPGTNAFGNGNSDIKFSSDVLDYIMNKYPIVSETVYTAVSWEQIE